MSEKKPTGVISIHGREYTTVAKRVQDFRETHPDYAITTEILHRDADVVIMRSVISDATGRVLATGHAEEWRKSSSINKTSAVENAETSAIGRALACLGWGGTEFASANEIETAKRKETVESPYEGDKPLPRAIPAAGANHDEFAALPPEAQDALRECGLEVTALCDEGRMEEALAVVANMCVTQEDKMALWSILPSKTRSALKKANQKEAA